MNARPDPDPYPVPTEPGQARSSCYTELRSQIAQFKILRVPRAVPFVARMSRGLREEPVVAFPPGLWLSQLMSISAREPTRLRAFRLGAEPASIAFTNRRT
jgi:hypothetical protein